jgi:hypothetical protein
MHGLWLVILFVLGALVAELARSLGRVLFGLAAGLRASHFVVGVGPVVGQTARLTVRLLPLQLAANWRLDDHPERIRHRLWLMTLGGLLGYLGVVLVVKACGVSLIHGAGPHLPARMIGVVAGIMLLGRVVPIDSRSAGRQSPSDGLQLWRILRAERQRLIDALQACVVLEVSELMRREQPAAALALCDRAIATFSALYAPTFRWLRCYPLERLGRSPEAKAAAAAAFEGPVNPAWRWIVLNDWSWYAFRVRDEADVRLADARSAEALSLSPKAPPVLGTRGAILLWRGRVSEAIPLLERSLTGAKTPVSRVINGCLIAIAHASRGESARATELLEAARAEGVSDPLLDEARRRVDAAVASFRVVFAARGRRALLVEPGGVVLVDGVAGRPETREELLAGARATRTLSLSEIAGVRVGQSPRGHARLLIAASDGAWWRLPLMADDLMWARLLAEDILSPTRPPVAIPKAPRPVRDVARGAIWGLGLVPFVSLVSGAKLWAGLELGSILIGGAVMVSRPAAPAALGFATFLLAKLALGDAPLAARVPGALWAFLVLAAGLAARRRPSAGPDGLGLTIGALLFGLAFEIFLALVPLLRGQADLSNFGVSLTVPALAAVAVVAVYGRRRGAARRGSPCARGASDPR